MQVYNPLMHLEHFELHDLGPIRTANLALVRRFNVLAGVNGAGKSTILGAIALMLGRYSAAVRTGKAVGAFDRAKIRRGAQSAQAIATARVGPGEGADQFTWSAGISRPGRVTPGLTRSRSLIEFAVTRAEQVERDPEQASLPIVVFYSVNRAVLEIPLRIRNKAPFGQYAALEEALTQGGRSFRTFFSWFRDREDYENERRADGHRRMDPQLTAVRRAVASMLPGFEDLRIKRQPVRMLVTKGGTDFRVDELSDGEKCLLAMVGDLARRLAIANPGSRNPLEGSVIALIDELELHLHPAWQRQAVVRLQETFPNCQFIVTTHSPQVLSEVAPEAIFLLREGRVVQPSRSYGRDSNLILEELMGAQSRPAWAEAALEALYEAIDDEAMDIARQRLLALEARLGVQDPGLTTARALLSSSVSDR
jgi:predicted ATP-binding protein involved in virulence